MVNGCPTLVAHSATELALSEAEGVGFLIFEFPPDRRPESDIESFPQSAPKITQSL